MEATPVTPAPVAPSESRPKPWATLIASLLAVVFLVLWLGAKSDADDANAKLDEITADAKADADAEAAAEAEVLDLEELAGDHRMASQGFLEDGSPDSISLSFPSGDLGDLDGLLDDVGFSSGIMARIGNTRALDGTLTATAPQATMSWSYHPDDGLSVVIERTE